MLTDPAEKLKKIRVVVLDVDGVLTDGRVGYGEGRDEIKFFDIKDGLGIKLLQQAGLKVGILSGRQSNANSRRAAELKLDFVYQGRDRKAPALTELLQELDIAADECLYMGDDLPDLAVFDAVGVSVTVCDAVPQLQEAADWVTAACGGRGAVREMAETLLQAQGRLSAIVESYRSA